MLTVEGENDDISGVGQTEAAHAITPSIPASMKAHYLQPKVGHYGVFNGSRFRAEIAPRIADFIATQRPPEGAGRPQKGGALGFFASSDFRRRPVAFCLKAPSASPSRDSYVRYRGTVMVYQNALRPAWTPLTIVLMVIGFTVAWPLGLLMLAYILFGERIPEVRRHFEGVRQDWEAHRRDWCGPRGGRHNGLLPQRQQRL